jgi:hypothetical protein
MPIVELLWTIQEDRRRMAALAARERSASRRYGRVSVVARLVGWARGRIRSLRDGSARPLGWTASR